MPFQCRTIEPTHVFRKRQHQFKSNRVFSEFEEVTNHGLIGVLLQLSSLTMHAEEMLSEIFNDVLIFQRRCEDVQNRIYQVQDLVDEMDPELEEIDKVPVEVEDSPIEPYLRYQSSNALEEDLFTKDNRNPCLIRLHQKATQDWNHILRGSNAYVKYPRPKSLDPNIWLDGNLENGIRNRNSTFLSSNNQLNSSKSQNHILPTPEEKMKLDTSDNMADVITIDTSGSKYEKQANARKSFRSGSCSVRQKSAAAHRRNVLRQRHKTITGLPGEDSYDLEITPRPQSARGSAGKNSFMDNEDETSTPSVINGHAITPREALKNAEMQTDDVQVLPMSAAQRRLRSTRGSNHGSHDTPIAVQCPSVTSDSLSQSTDNISRPDTLSVPGSMQNSEFNSPCSNQARTPASPTNDAGVVNGNSIVTTTTTATHAQNGTAENGDDFMRSNDTKRVQQTEDRTSSGFWSGTESTRHSSASDIMQQHAHVTQALQQILKSPRPLSPPDSAISVSTVTMEEESSPQHNGESTKPSQWYASSIASSSINSRLSTLDRSHNSSLSSLKGADDEMRYRSSDSSIISARIEQALGHPEGRKKKSPLPANQSPNGSTSVSPLSLIKAKKNKGGEYSFMNSLDEDLDKKPYRKPSSRFSFRGRKSSKQAKYADAPSSVVLERKVMTSQNGMVAMSECSFRSEDSGSLVPTDSIVNGMSASQAISMTSIEQEGTKTPQRNSARTENSSTPTPTDVADGDVFQTPNGFRNGNESNNQTSPNYLSYQRAVKSNHDVPKTLIEKANSSRSDTSSTGTISPATGTPRGSKKSKGPRPPPPKRNSSLSTATTPTPSRSPLPTVQENKNVSSPRTPLSPINNSSFMNELSSAIKSSHSVRKTKSPTRKTTENQPSFVTSTPNTDNTKKLSSKYPEMAYMEPLRSPIISTNTTQQVTINTTTTKETVNKQAVEKKETTSVKKVRPPPPPKPARTSSIRSSSSVKSPTPREEDKVEKSPSKHEDKISASSPSTVKEQTPEKSVTPVYFSTAIGHNWARVSDKPYKHVSVKKHQKVGDSSNQVQSEVKPKLIEPQLETRRGSDDVFLDSPKLIASGNEVKESLEKMGASCVKETGDKKDTITEESLKSDISEREVKTITKAPEVKPKPKLSLSAKNASARAAFFGNDIGSSQEKEVTETTTSTPAVNDDVIDSGKLDEVQVNNNIKDEIKTDDAIEEKPKESEISVSNGDVENREVTSNNTTVDDELTKENESNMSELLKLETSSPGLDTSDRKTPALKLSIPTSESPRPVSMNANSAVLRLLGSSSNRTKKTSYTRSKSLNSPPVSPGIMDGKFSPNSSPVSTLERSRNARLTTNTRSSSRKTSRDNFKSLLLQSATRNSTDGRMSATEKLKLTKNQSAVKSLSSTLPKSKSIDLDATDSKPLSLTPRSGIASISDIRSRVRSPNGVGSGRQGRPYKRTTPQLAGSTDLGAKTKQLCVHGDQPPISINKYNSLKRSKTPTRLMMSISEDNEIEKSPETTRAESD